MMNTDDCAFRDDCALRGVTGVLPWKGCSCSAVLLSLSPGCRGLSLFSVPCPSAMLLLLQVCQPWTEFPQTLNQNQPLLQVVHVGYFVLMTRQWLIHHGDERTWGGDEESCVDLWDKHLGGRKSLLCRSQVRGQPAGQ